MNSALYEHYLTLLSEGRRKDAASMLDAFLRSFNSSQEREQWTRSFLKTHTYGERIRHEVYAELIFPVLLAGSKRNDAWSLYWLAGTCRNLSSAHKLSEIINFKGQTDLLKEAYAIDCKSTEVRQQLLKSLLDDFDYASHEWPAGILWSTNGATFSQCNEIISEVALARELDRDGAYALSIDDFESKVKQYKERLTSLPSNGPIITRMPITDFMGVIVACLIAEGRDPVAIKELEDQLRQVATDRPDLVERYNNALVHRHAGEIEHLWFQCRQIQNIWSNLRINGVTGRVHFGHSNRSYPLFPRIFQVWELR